MIVDQRPRALLDTAAWNGKLSSSRRLVHERIAEAYVVRFVERANRIPARDPFRCDVGLGPLIKDRQLRRETRIADRTGATREGRFYRPTVLTVTPALYPF